MLYLYLSIAISVIVFAWGALGFLKARRNKIKDKQIKEISEAIRRGAIAFLYKEYRALIIFIITIGALLYFFINHNMAWVFFGGAILNFIAINLGMRIALLGNAQMVEVLKTDKRNGLKIAFKSSSLIGLITISTGLFGVGIAYLIFGDLQVIYGVGLGASLVALFIRAGGGIYAKAADIGVDWLEKLTPSEKNKSYLIVDSIGDNVGDIAGNNSDLFESYVSAIIAAMVIGGVGLFVFLPIALVAGGIIATIAGIIFIRTRKGEFFSSKVLKQGVFGTALLGICFSIFIIKFITGSFILCFPFLIGLISGMGIGLVTEFFTSYRFKATQKVALSAQFGSAVNILKGLSLGVQSGLIPTLIIFLTVWFSYLLGDIYGIAIATIGMLSTLGMVLTINGFGSIIDNALNVSKIIDLDKNTIAKIEKIDATGNVAAAVSKGFALSATMLTVFVLMINYSLITEIGTINILAFKTIIGLFIGALLPFLFSSFIISSIGKMSTRIIKELRKQFKKAGYSNYSMTNIESAAREITLPIILVAIIPILVGFLLGAKALGGLLISASMVGFFLAIAMNNSGTILENSKKYLEAGNLGGQKSETYKYSVVGDIVGDSLKDATGPSINILLKLIAIIALIIAPFL